MGETQPARRVTIDGETWEIRRSGSQYRFKWLTGKAKGYGFTSRLNDTEFRLSPEQIEETIREFMSNVNPKTGRLGD